MLYKILLDRRSPDGGFSEQPGGGYRPDATAWAILCLKAFKASPEVVSAARARLCQGQLNDGRIPVNLDHPEAFWPTAIASLALAGDEQFAASYHNTLNFLLNSGGERHTKESDSPIGHNTSLQGWSWIAGTHSWTEPTAMTIRALVLGGKADNRRVQEGIKLLLDRQLPGGGWNYGSTTIYGKTMDILPAPTGLALWSLAGLVAQKQINSSLDLLQERLPRLHTPYSLGWAVLGMKAWNVAPPKVNELIEDCLERQGRFSLYGTSHLGILLLAAESFPSSVNTHA